jgi:REP element-mobilizing transposase RayT
VGAGLPALILLFFMTNRYHHSHLLRKGRHSEASHAYLITTVTHERRRLFSDWRLGRLVAHEIAAAPVDTLAWVVMPDHLHWLFQLRAVPLQRVVGPMKSRSAQAINRALSRTGEVWQKGYHDHGVRQEEDLRALARYVVANPLRAGLAEHIGDYPLWDAAWL